MWIPIGPEMRCWNVRIPALVLCNLLVALVGRAAVLDPPSLRCASVGPGGAAVLSWVPPADPGGDFLRYEIFHASSPAGPFAWVGQVTSIGTTTFTHGAAGTNAAPQYYYLTTVSSSGPPNTSANSDTLATIFVQVTQSVPLGGSVVDWNLPHTPPLPTAAPYTGIFMEHPIGTWVLTDSVAAAVHHWQRTVSICQDSLAFRVRIPDASGCASLSSASGAQFQDITPPTVPVIVSATVDTATNHAVLHWNPSPEGDTQGYIIVLSAGGVNTILDTIYGRLNTTYTWPLGNAGAGAESYTVAAIDSCWKGTPPSPNTSAASAPHTTVYTSTRYDRCAATIQVSRTNYAGWPVDHYELYLQMDHAGPLVLLSLMPPGTLQFTVQNVEPQRQYCFVVKAIGQQPGQWVLSNLTCRATAYPPVPQWNYLRTATVAAPDQVVVTDSLDPVGFTKRLVLERSYNGLPWQTVASAIPGAATVLSFTDANVVTAERSYTYRVLAEDSCGTVTATSNKGTSILLQADPAPDGINHLRWAGYVQWAGNVAAYNIYRSVAGGPFLPVGSTGGMQWSFDDNVQGLWESPGRFCYYVEAVEAGNPAGIDAISTSNVVCAVQQEEVWVPNAFIEGGYNNTFKPVLAFADVSRYRFAIFNRWSQLIWETTNPDQAWDGRVNDTVVPQGVYAWYCTFTNGAGKTVERKGTVTFLPGR